MLLLGDPVRQELYPRNKLTNIEILCLRDDILILKKHYGLALEHAKTMNAFYEYYVKDNITYVFFIINKFSYLYKLMGRNNAISNNQIAKANLITQAMFDYARILTINKNISDFYVSYLFYDKWNKEMSSSYPEKMLHDYRSFFKDIEFLMQRHPECQRGNKYFANKTPYTLQLLLDNFKEGNMSILKDCLTNKHLNSDILDISYNNFKNKTNDSKIVAIIELVKILTYYDFTYLEDRKKKDISEGINKKISITMANILSSNLSQAIITFIINNFMEIKSLLNIEKYLEQVKELNKVTSYVNH